MAAPAGLSRRAFLTCGLGVTAAAAAVTGGYCLVEAGVLPGKYRLARALGSCGGDPPIPAVTAGPVVAESFGSRFRHRVVEMITMMPPGGVGRAGLAVTVVLHGAGGDARSSVKLGLPAFLAQAVTRSGVPPSALVSFDGGGSTYWHPRADGDDPLAMVIHEVLPRLAASGHSVGSVGIFGWSMGGYGALLLAERLGAAHSAPRVAAVAASSPALFASYQAARAANRLAFDGPADFAANDVARGLGTLRRLPVMVDCGSDDPFAPQDSLLRRRLGDPPGAMGSGCHDTAFWRRRLPAQLAFIGAHLPPTPTASSPA